MPAEKNDNEPWCCFPDIFSYDKFDRVVCLAEICGPGFPLDTLALLSYDGGDDDVRVTLYNTPRSIRSSLLPFSFVMEALEACRVHLLIDDNDLPPAHERLGEVWQASHSSIITPTDPERDICTITLSGPEDVSFPVGLLFRDREDGEARINIFNTPEGILVPFPVLMDALNSARKALEQAAGG